MEKLCTFPNFNFSLLTRTDSFHDQLVEDSTFLKADRRLDTELVDKVILQLNRIYPQILTDKEATRVSWTTALCYADSGVPADGV